MLCALLAASAGLDSATRLEVDALIQEGGLLRDEFERLRGPAEALAVEGAQLDEQEQSLRAASQELNQDIQEFNTALSDLERAAQALQARCPRESEDKNLVEACNAEVARIRAQAHERDAQRPQLARRQHQLNTDIEQHNGVREEWASRKSKHDAMLELARRDLGAWLERAQRFFDTAGYRAAYNAVGKPSACAPEGLRDLAAAPAPATLQRALDCLQALEGQA